MDWETWFDDLFRSERRLVVSARQGAQKEITIQPEKPYPTAKPQRSLLVPAAAVKQPPGKGWRRTPNGWARGDGDSYEWRPL